MQTSIKIANKPSEITACLELRWTVFVEEQGVSEEEERDGEDDICSHVLAQIEDNAVGAARFKLIKDYVKIQRVCVLKYHRGKNIGADIIRFIIQYVSQSKIATSVQLGAQIHAVEFYRKLCFQKSGTEYMDAGIPHVDMVLRLVD